MFSFIQKFFLIYSQDRRYGPNWTILQMSKIKDTMQIQNLDMELWFWHKLNLQKWFMWKKGQVHVANSENNSMKYLVIEVYDPLLSGIITCRFIGVVYQDHS
jgi:hypothetical protein